MIRYLSLIILLLCSACIQLGGEPQPTRYYLLEPVKASHTETTSKPLQLQMSPLEFPSYLDRPQLVTRTANNSILIAEYDRWAEPLLDNLNRTLRENLRNRLPNLRINSAPWNNTSGPGYQLRITINRFDGTLGQQTDVDLRWTLIEYQNGKELARHHFHAQHPLGDSYQDLIDGLNRALAELCQEISSVLAAQQ